MSDPIKCPVCNGEFQVYDFFTHLYTTHEAFLAAWTSLAFPIVNDLTDNNNVDGLAQFFRNLGVRDVSNYGQLFNNEIFDYENETDVFDQLSYEQLTAMCDEMGYHKVGIKNIDAIAPAIVRMKKNTDDDRCPICLEDMHKAIYMRVIKECKHEYCGNCIEEWLKKNKNCPICKLELHEPNEETTPSDLLPELIDYPFEPTQIPSISESSNSSGGNIDLESLSPPSSEFTPSSANVT
jgi:hypothetical protein